MRIKTLRAAIIVLMLSFLVFIFVSAYQASIRGWNDLTTTEQASIHKQKVRAGQTCTDKIFYEDQVNNVSLALCASDDDASKKEFMDACALAWHDTTKRAQIEAILGLP